ADRSAPGLDPEPRQRPAPVSTPAATLMVAEREIVTQVRAKSFVISLIITLALALGGIVVASYFADRGQEAVPVAVVGGAGEELGAVDGFETTTADDVAAAEDLVRAEEVEAAIVAD